MSTEFEIRRQLPSEWQLGENLIPVPVESLSLYVHIPFCTSRCRYCNFYFETGWSPRVVQRTLETIADESREFRRALFPDIRPVISSVYIGGGTPSVIPAEKLDSFLADFREIWALDEAGNREWAFEANPETTTPKLIQVLARHGVNRVSLGIQSFDDGILQLLGRRAGKSDAYRAIETVQRAKTELSWKAAVNMDLIVGIPGQDVASVARDVRACIDGGADHVSIYTLTVEEHTPMAQLFDEGLYKALEAEQVEELWLAADAELEGAGLMNYEVSNYARPGFESKHNLSYWELRPYVGLGPGAVGTIPAELTAGTAVGSAEVRTDGTAGGAAAQQAVVRMTNPNAFNYSRASRSRWEHSVEVLTPRDFLIDHFLTGLRMQDGVDVARLETIFHLDPGALRRLLNPLIAAWRDRNLIQTAATVDKLALNRRGRALLNILLEEVLECLESLVLPELTPRWPL